MQLLIMVPAFCTLLPVSQVRSFLPYADKTKRCDTRSGLFHIPLVPVLIDYDSFETNAFSQSPHLNVTGP